MKVTVYYSFLGLFTRSFSGPPVQKGMSVDDMVESISKLGLTHDEIVKGKTVGKTWYPPHAIRRIKFED